MPGRSKWASPLKLASQGPTAASRTYKLAATFAFTVRVGRLLTIGPKLTDLIAAGTSICAASAACVRCSSPSRCLPSLSCPISCVSIHTLTVSAAGYRFTKSRRSSPRLSRTASAPEKSERRASWLGSCCLHKRTLYST